MTLRLRPSPSAPFGGTSPVRRGRQIRGVVGRLPVAPAVAPGNAEQGREKAADQAAVPPIVPAAIAPVVPAAIVPAAIAPVVPAAVPPAAIAPPGEFRLGVDPDIGFGLFLRLLP